MYLVHTSSPRHRLSSPIFPFGPIRPPSRAERKRREQAAAGKNNPSASLNLRSKGGDSKGADADAKAVSSFQAQLSAKLKELQDQSSAAMAEVSTDAYVVGARTVSDTFKQHYQHVYGFRPGL